MKKLLMITSLIFVVFLGACSSNFGNMNPFNMMKERPEGSMMMGHGQSDVPLQHSTGENELKIPPVLKSDEEDGNDVYYTIEAQKGQTEIFEGIQTKTLGYNSSFLGPVMKLKKGQTTHIKLKNSLDEETTFHWHGLIIAGDADGGPHNVIQPGEEKEITFDVKQDRATLWFHPHPEGKTAKQVFDGLAGLLYIEDDMDDLYVYGENDFPLIIQDRTFNKQKQLDYEAVKNADGTMGGTLLINGTLNPRLTVNKEKVRFRLLNGSNMRNYTFKLSNNQSFQQVASDGGLLNEPVELTELQLTPSERAEIVVDFSEIEKNKDVELITDDGTVLLPFKVEGAEKEVKDEILEPINPVTISNEEMEQQVSKEIVLSGMGHHVSINGNKFDKDRIDFKIGRASC